MYNENVAVADLNGDGYKEVFGPTDTHYITALDRGGNQLPASAIYGAGKVWSQVGVHVDHAVDLRGYANCGVEHRPNFADSAPIVADVNGGRHARDGGGRQRLQLRRRTPTRASTRCRSSSKLDRTRWSGSGFDWTAIPAPGPGSGPRSEDYNVIETAVPNPVAGRPRRRRAARDPLPLLRRQAPRLLARQDRARELAVHVPGAGTLPLRQRAGGGRPRRRRPGGGDLHLLAEEGRPAASGQLHVLELARGRAPTRVEPARPGIGGDLERRPRARRPSPTSTRDADLEVVLGTVGERGRGLRPAGHRGRARAVAHGARRVPPHRHDRAALADDRRRPGDRGQRRDDERGLHGPPLRRERAGGDGRLRHGRRHRDGPRRLHGDRGHAQLPGGHDDAHGHRARRRRSPRRGERDVPRAPVERGRRAPRGRAGDGHDRGRRPAPRPLDRRRVGRGGRDGNDGRRLHAVALRPRAAGS